MRRTKQTLAVAAALLDRPQDRHWGYPLTKSSGVRAGVLYPILSRMLAEGWLEDAWENAALAASEGRPPRRYYRLTPRGIVALGGTVDDSGVMVTSRALGADGAR